MLSPWASVTLTLAETHGGVPPVESAPAHSSAVTYSMSAGTSHAVVCPAGAEITDSWEPPAPACDGALGTL
jgi:hypothetical protein